MKRIIFSIVAVCFIHVVSAQTDQKPLDGKVYGIDLFINNEKDSHQTLTFSDGRMNFSEAAKYGFSQEEYKCKQKNDTTWTFLVVSKSAKNGMMTWDGKVVNDHVEGTCTWTRLVENPVKYTFSGKEFKTK